MTVECKWIQSRGEDLLSDDADTRQRIESHLEKCAACRLEVEGYRKVDRMVAAYFDHRVQQAGSQRRSLRRGQVSAAVAGIAVALVLVWFGVANDGVFPTTVSSESALGFPEGDPPGSEPSGIPDPLRAKPELGEIPAVSTISIREPIEPPPGETQFYVMDAAGYFHTLADFSGSVLLLAVFDETQTGTEAFERLYSRYGSRPDLRLLAVALGPDTRPPAASFPFLVNGGSSLLQTEAGGFAILTEEGRLHRRGSMEDPQLESVVRSGLQELGIE